ncbi:bifunctional MaoC family dehydratase N-terminal/OB-fold nucleic acid binding domain-containing protein [Streptomyces brevispora]|uniref:bifunctional MaoC family dehydratase N-terminal/OB-fold nucleic acid binding domain-containing protein n=1 Tax=Streptomyces brevispora TaxID=887462 RepID=UPI003407AB07
MGGQGVRDELYERLRVYEGRAAAVAGIGKDLVNEPMIRHWCEAMGDANPAYTGPGAVAPPTMLQAWTMGGLSGHTDRGEAYDELFGLLDGAGYVSVVATDCEQEYLRPLRPGDRITFDAVIEAVSERKTTKLGTGYFITTRMDVRAQDEPAGTHRFRILKFRPAEARPAGAGVGASEGALARTGTGNVVRMGARADGRETRGREARGTEAQRKETQRIGSELPADQRGGRSLRPRPVINRDNAGFWKGIAAHQLLIQRCGACGTLRFPWLPGCNACGSPEWETAEASGEGTVFSYVVMHHPPFPAFSESDEAGPYAVALIELAEGVRMVSNVIGVPYDKVRVGMPVRLEFLRTDSELELPVFRGSEG